MITIHIKKQYMLALILTSIICTAPHILSMQSTERSTSKIAQNTIIDKGGTTWVSYFGKNYGHPIFVSKAISGPKEGWYVGVSFPDPNYPNRPINHINIDMAKMLWEKYNRRFIS